jgi:hypothetical protein
MKGKGKHGKHGWGGGRMNALGIRAHTQVRPNVFAIFIIRSHL